METREKEKNEATKEMRDPKTIKQEKTDAAKVIAKRYKKKPLL
ncbi:hypothetical protein [Mucilaginibacter ginsenosidivorax]|nr:hypothetical protein [Mucilaginibacter ginsenosidivorax]